MYKIRKVTLDNINEIECIYNDFHMKSSKEFGFEIPPLEYKDLSYFIDKGLLNILSLKEEKGSQAKGMLIFDASSDIVELSVIHVFGDNPIAKKEALVKALKEEIKEGNHRLISYAMLGAQSDFVRKIAHYGFDFVGQAIVKFDFVNSNSPQIFDKLPKLEIPDDIEIISWNEKYAKDIVPLIQSSFEGMQDSKFDPRFETKEGCEDIIAKITQGIYGDFLPKYTKILLKDDVPKGFCMVNLTTAWIANIPIIGVDKELKSQGLGSILMQDVLNDIIKGVQEKDLYIKEFNATVDTDNYPALKMYRHFGFKESENYPQAYCDLK